MFPRNLLVGEASGQWKPLCPTRFWGSSPLLSPCFTQQRETATEESEVVGARPCSHFPAVGMLGPRLRTRNVSPDFAPTLSMEKLRPPLCCEAFLGT